ncbi:MAG: thioredoxin [Treponemataceae bacterium]|uniref:thioredoxin n=1 Tax=Treponema sp. J25 TaxID=2094121 RepID=UPI001047FDF7|nr:thioredoxin [Treponema sp. J25]MCX7949980.1 thioredoxin [Treponemataceae bacterium]HOJ99948.1 thioredoxin [Termitinemataceae bacterium]TCW60888.1 thioredoxin [Treponema sp. J25]HOM24412.1 thioredoxin [Termitinemataceae bacterium]HPQ01296.1 thioredoxin [Termitinemataceae bacterium]
MSLKLTTAEFKEKVFDYEKNTEWAYAGDLPAIVDFYADWCGPCKMVSPILDQLSKEYEGKIHVYKVNTDEEQELASVFGIQSIPTILFIPKEGQPQAAMGALPKATLERAIQEVLGVTKEA